MPTALVHGSIAVPHVARLRGKIGPEWTIKGWDPATDDVDAFAALVADADVIIGGGIPTKSWPAVPKLKLFQIPWTGYEFTAPEKVPAGIPVANCFEHESAIAEYILAAMLEWQIGLRRMDQNFRAKGWDGRGPGEQLFHGEVRGRTVGIVGYGHIGAEVAKRAKAFDMRCIGVRRRVQETPENLDWLGTVDRLDELLQESDFVVVACDLNEETRNLINAERLARMKPTGVLINIARGGVVEEAPLYEALRDRRIGGAVIDVWYNYKRPGEDEPWPTNFPFQDLENTILTAHESGWTIEQVERRWDFVAENVERVMRGEQPQNVVFHGTQTAE